MIDWTNSDGIVTLTLNDPSASANTMNDAYLAAMGSAVERLQAEGHSVAHAHLRHMNPFPTNTEEVVRSYHRVLIPEVNLGQLLMLIRARFLVDAIGYDRVRGKPFRIAEIVDEAERILRGLE